MKHRRSERDDALRAVVEHARPLRYREGADPSTDRPAHVRAGSGVTWWRDRLAVVQDDTAILALVDPRDALADALPLPMPDGVRQFGAHLGNKKLKPDHESVFAVDGTLVALGSGSTRARYRVLRCTAGGAPELIDAAPLYRCLEDDAGFAGSELNVEGACVVGGALRLFQRGNGAARGERIAVDATAEIDLARFLAWLDDPAGAPPPHAGVTRWLLDPVDDGRLCFTDACARDDGAVLFLAAAEDSPNTYDDGEAGACALGIIPAEGPARHAAITDARGAPLRVKVEGITLDRDDPSLAWVVVDRDDPDAPSELLAVRLAGY